MSDLPVLYSFRRCPYAIRARMAICAAGVPVQLREVLLKNKPVALIEASAKATVPVLVLADGRVIDESLAVIDWALEQHDPEGWADTTAETEALISQCDGSFKGWLDQYKYADRYPGHSPEYYREQAEVFIAGLEQRLAQQQYLGGATATRADVAVFPFVRQFAGVDPGWWQGAAYPEVRRWLSDWLASQAFTQVMAKYPPWQPEGPGVVFPDSSGS
jgi:glutathione S-transferase